MKIGIFGGTFDPPHIGHINAFKAFVEQFDFDRVFVIPVCTPPHKSLKSTVTAEDRMNMAFLAFGGISKNVVISDIEIKRQGKSYTADTIKHFKEQGYDDIYFLCGTDMLLTLDMWYKPEYILKNAKIVFARRENEQENTERIASKIEKYTEKYGATVIPLKTNVLEISSTEIRDGIKRGETEYLSSRVAEYITENGLYTEGE